MPLPVAPPRNSSEDQEILAGFYAILLLIEELATQLALRLLDLEAQAQADIRSEKDKILLYIRVVRSLRDLFD